MLFIIVGVFEKMKFSSVIVSVLFFSVTVAFSDSNIPGSASTNFKELQTEYQHRNIQNGNTQYRPDLQVKRAPIDVSNAYIKTQRIDNIQTQLSPNENNHRIRPESNYPIYPASQHVSNTKITNHPDVRLHPQATRFQHIISNPKIKALYTASKPTKRYTIIHSNGTVEHTDELHSIAARHPNYVLVKADDLLSRNSKATNIGNTNYSSQTTPPVQTNKYPQSVEKLIAATTQNIEKARIGQNSPQSNTNFEGTLVNPRYTYQHIQNPQIQKLKISNQFPIEKSTSTFQHSTLFSNPSIQRKPTVRHENIKNTPSTVKSFNKAVLTAVPNTSASQIRQSIVPLSHEYEVTSDNFVENVAISNPAAIYEPIRQAIGKSKSSNGKQEQNDSKLKIENTSFDKSLRGDAVAINPLPIYPSDSPQITTAISDKPYVSSAAIEPAVKQVNTPEAILPKQQPILSLENQDMTFNPLIIKSIEEAIVASNSNSTSLSKVSNLSVNDQTIPNTTFPISTETPLHETIPVILPQVVSQSTQKELETPTTEITTQETNKPNIIETENKSTEPNKTTSLRNVLGLGNNQFLESSKNTLNETDGTVQSNTTSLDNTETDKLVKQHVTSSTVETVDQSSVANDSSKISSNIVPLTWFSLSEENLWEALKNNTHNVYFFFMPPRPKVSKEIKTIIFPNGTTIEEITEIVSDIDGAEPKTTTRTRLL